MAPKSEFDAAVEHVVEAFNFAQSEFRDLLDAFLKSHDQGTYMSPSEFEDRVVAIARKLTTTTHGDLEYSTIAHEAFREFRRK